MTTSPVPASLALDLRPITEGLKFPEGPIAMADGSVLLVEIERGTLSRVDVATGAVDVVADCGGGPNGAALGPDGKIYVTNNGGYYSFLTSDGVTIPGPSPDSYDHGSIQRVDPVSGEVETVYEACDGRPLVAPNDLVFDAFGGFWFTDHGVQRGEHPDRPGLLYAKADGSEIRAMAFGTDGTNGVGLSPDGSRVFAAETHGGTVWEWAVGAEPGTFGEPLDPESLRSGGRLLFTAPDGWLFDSLAVDGEGWVCVATIGRGGGITAISPEGSRAENVPSGDFLTTNICFGGPSHGNAEYRTAYITCSSSGRLAACEWPRKGGQLA